MSERVLLREGDRGAAVRDLRSRLVGAGVGCPPGDTYDADTIAAVRRFQEQRGLRIDGICGPETWGALIESGYRLGDRLLYVARPMQRGDDVGELQRRLNALGFDAGREDGIFGPGSERALRSFQRDAGLTVDGMFGPQTRAALDRVDGLAAGSVARVRERDQLARAPRRLDGLRLFLAVDPALGALGKAVARTLFDTGVVIGLDTSGADPSVIAAEANRYKAEAFVALVVGPEPGARCAYFANQQFRSEGGYCLAQRITEAMSGTGSAVEAPQGRTYRLLRETRMAAVVCELAADGSGPDVARALAEGIRRGVEEPVD
ncbi:MAG TPA: peptidoglycan-binding protein [Acidimicrobiia bacterium]|nr:peptidoglycan-binding protein [Acidimicrobiia bacterium]